jgi:NADH-dependent peroxiredoxin subunit C
MWRTLGCMTAPKSSQKGVTWEQACFIEQQGHNRREMDVAPRMHPTPVLGIQPDDEKENPMASIINSEIPDFSVQAFHNGEFKTVSRGDLKGKWSVFFFYPADFTFVCPTELGDLADKYDKLRAMGVEVYAVSTDTHFVHKAWHDASATIKKIKFPMLADPTGALSRAFGVYIDAEGLAYRGSFVVNPEGKIKAAEIHDNGIGRNADELVRKVQAAQFVATHDGEVCPAKWTPGAATLKPGLDLVGKI